MQFYKSHFWKHVCFLSSKKRYFRFKIIIMAFKQYCCITLYYIVDNITKINTISSQNTKYLIYNYSNPTNKFIYICIHFVACACFCSHVTHVLFADVRRHTSARPDREEPRFQKKTVADGGYGNWKCRNWKCGNVRQIFQWDFS